MSKLRDRCECGNEKPVEWASCTPCRSRERREREIAAMRHASQLLRALSAQADMQPDD